MPWHWGQARPENHYAHIANVVTWSLASTMDSITWAKVEQDTSPPSPPSPTPATGAGNGARHTTLRMAAPARQPLLHYDDDGAHSTMASWSSGRWVLISIRQHTNSTCGDQ